MHAVGLHSALAIRRERKRRAEQQRARERRYSLQSSESGVTSPHCSTGSLERRRYKKTGTTDNEVVSSVGMLHLGVVFLVLGVFLVASGWLPDDVTSWSSIGSVSWFNELVCSGLFALGIGIFLIALHKYLTKSEEDALEDYVQRQLTRSRSGHRLERDAETGGMRTKGARRARTTEVLPETVTETYTEPSPDRVHGFVNALAINGDAMRETPLEQIVEEEMSVASENERRLGKFNKDTYSTPSVAPSLSPGSPSDTHMLQSLLQPRDNQRPKMIGAMPAVAVRHERRRAEKRTRRPSQLPLQLGRVEDATPSPDHHLRGELYVCGKVAFLHAIVGSLLLGIVILVVGLVQLSPGAEAAQHRYYLMGAGGLLFGLGVLGAVLRCLCLHWYNIRYREDYEDRVRSNQKNCVSVVESHHEDHHRREERPKLKPQPSVHDVDLIKQPSVASDT